MEKTISTAVIKRLPRYYRHIQDLEKAGVFRISSKDLANKLGLTASQIRQDLNCFGGFGQQGYGYNVTNLKEQLAEILGIDKSKTAVLIGVGNIGKALMKNFDFEGSGFKLLAGFDTNPDVIGREFEGVRVLDGHEMKAFMQKNKPDIAILTIPRHIAAVVAKDVVDSGVRGIWNFTNVDLHIENVPIEHVHLSDSLMTLCYNVE